MNYTRVIPRDFFNESKLLKCMGQLSLMILDCKLPDGISIEIGQIEGSTQGFDVGLTDSGILVVTNYYTLVNGEFVEFGTRYNSKSPYPMVCTYEYEEYDVFNDDGTISDEFINFAKTPRFVFAVLIGCIISCIYLALFY